MKQFTKRNLQALTKAELADLARKNKIAVSPRSLKAGMVQIIHAALNKERRAPAKSRGLTGAKKKEKVTRTAGKEAGKTKVGSKKRAPAAKKRKEIPAKKAGAVRERTLSRKPAMPTPVPLTRRVPPERPPFKMEKAFQETPQPRHEKRTPAPPNMPPSTGISRIYALLQDPQWVYCFWDLGADQKKEALRRLGCPEPGAATILRVWDHTRPKEPTCFDIDPGFGADNYYVRLDEGKRYRLEIGLRSPKGKFYPLAQSDEIQTPRFFPPLRLKAAALPRERTFTEKEFLKIYALTYGLDHDILPGEILDTLGGLPAATSPGIVSPGAARKF